MFRPSRPRHAAETGCGTGKQIPLHAPQFFFAREREIADEAFAGDVVGIPNHGTLRIGDTLTEGEDITFTACPISLRNCSAGCAWTMR